ncbi:MAG: 16S rRNA processing protein RimM [Candidatus Eremiobacteraeota bacterium]|nr:16S rRNA processing protein RimM [Candidatus Eremiobacteraeota bacterium]
MKNPQTEIVVGRISGTFGVSGELKCDPTSVGRILFSAGSEFRCELQNVSQTVRIAAARNHKSRLLVRLEGVDDVAAAQSYVGARIYADRTRVPLQEGEFFDADLIGCTVHGTTGEEYGVVDDVEHYPASDMLVVRGGWIPMVGAIVLAVDLSKREITIDPPQGLLDEG